MNSITSPPPPGKGAARVVMACLSVCLSARIFNKLLYTLPVSVARSSSGGVAIRCALPVLWMTSCFYLMDPIARYVYAQQRFHHDLSHYRTLIGSSTLRVKRNRASACCSDDWKCPKSCFGPFDFGLRRLSGDAPITRGCSVGVTAEIVASLPTKFCPTIKTEYLPRFAHRGQVCRPRLPGPYLRLLSFSLPGFNFAIKD